MRYPIIMAGDASRYLLAKRGDAPMDVDSVVQMRGSGEELNQWFVAPLRAGLERLCAKIEGGLGSKTDPAANTFEARASRLVHASMPSNSEVLADPDFWVWLSVVHFPEVVEWRYRYQNRSTDGFAQLGNYGIGSRSDNLMYRLWFRAELVLDVEANDRYHLSDAGQIDFYRSHLFRQGLRQRPQFLERVATVSVSERGPRRAAAKDHRDS